MGSARSLAPAGRRAAKPGPLRTPQPCAARPCPLTSENPIRLLTLTAAIALIAAPVARSGTSTPRAYAHQLTITHWHSEQQWQALDAIVRPESGWDSCSVYPSRHNCSYKGANSCGIPQASPCPRAWRGRLASSWRAQVDWLIRYVARRYGSPAEALAFRRRNGWY